MQLLIFKLYILKGNLTKIQKEELVDGKVIREATGIEIIKVKMVKPECVGSSFCEDTKKRAESAAKEAALKADQKRIEAKKENDLAILKGEQDRETQQRKGELERNLLSIEANLTMIKAKASATITEAEAEAVSMEIKAKAEKKRLTPAFLSCSLRFSRV